MRPDERRRRTARPSVRLDAGRSRSTWPPIRTPGAGRARGRAGVGRRARPGRAGRRAGAMRRIPPSQPALRGRLIASYADAAMAGGQGEIARVADASGQLGGTSAGRGPCTDGSRPTARRTPGAGRSSPSPRSSVVAVLGSVAGGDSSRRRSMPGRRGRRGHARPGRPARTARRRGRRSGRTTRSGSRPTAGRRSRSAPASPASTAAPTSGWTTSRPSGVRIELLAGRSYHRVTLPGRRDLPSSIDRARHLVRARDRVRPRPRARPPTAATRVTLLGLQHAVGVAGPDLRTTVGEGHAATLAWTDGGASDLVVGPIDPAPSTTRGWSPTPAADRALGFDARRARTRRGRTATARPTDRPGCRRPRRGPGPRPHPPRPRRPR